mmetsp:Transcript_20694/g.46279  ORF Transcript_20694/g.46279 Transcript_20694/m.46279 type:complete len:324 (+) Transcript_20694:554-1525(+)
MSCLHWTQASRITPPSSLSSRVRSKLRSSAGNACGPTASTRLKAWRQRSCRNRCSGMVTSVLNLPLPPKTTGSTSLPLCALGSEGAAALTDAPGFPDPLLPLPAPLPARPPRPAPPRARAAPFPAPPRPTVTFAPAAPPRPTLPEPLTSAVDAAWFPPLPLAARSNSAKGANAGALASLSSVISVPIGPSSACWWPPPAPSRATAAHALKMLWRSTIPNIDCAVFACSQFVMTPSRVLMISCTSSSGVSRAMTAKNRPDMAFTASLPPRIRPASRKISSQPASLMAAEDGEVCERASTFAFDFSRGLTASAASRATASEPWPE